MHQAGGRIQVNIGGRRFAPRGKATIKPARVSHTANTNHDGTVSRSTAAMPASAELTFDRGGDRFKWDVSLMGPFMDVTILEMDVGVMHVFTNATMIGEPSIDTETGEVTGLSIVTDQYLQTKAA